MQAQQEVEAPELKLILPPVLSRIAKKKLSKHRLCSSLGSSNEHQPTKSSPLPPGVCQRQLLF